MHPAADIARQRLDKGSIFRYNDGNQPAKYVKGGAPHEKDHHANVHVCGPEPALFVLRRLKCNVFMQARFAKRA